MATFVAVVSSNSFSLAADRCGISRALVTKHIQELETSLGIKLLHRTTRKLGLTQAGERFYERCTRVISDAEDAIRELEDSSIGAHGLIRVSTAISFGRLHLLPAVADFLRENPSVQIDVALSEQFGDLISGGADIVIRMADEPHLSNLVARRLATVHSVVIASPAYCAAHSAITKPADLLRLNCLTYAGAANREWRLSGPDGDHTLKVSGNYRANNGDGIVEAALAGVGVGIVPRFIASPHLASGRLLQILPEYTAPTRTLYAIFLPDRNLPERIRAFVRFLSQRFGPVPYWDLPASVER